MGGVSLNRCNKKVVRIITAHPSLKIFDVPWSEIICKWNVGVTSEFWMMGVRWVREIPENRCLLNVHLTR